MCPATPALSLEQAPGVPRAAGGSGGQECPRGCCSRVGSLVLLRDTRLVPSPLVLQIDGAVSPKPARTEGLCLCSWTESQDRGTLSPSTRREPFPACSAQSLCLMSASSMTSAPRGGTAAAPKPLGTVPAGAHGNGHYLHKIQLSLGFFREAPEITSRVSKGISWSFPESTATGGFFCK